MEQKEIYNEIFKIVSRIRLDEISDRETEIKKIMSLISTAQESALKDFKEEIREKLLKTPYDREEPTFIDGDWVMRLYWDTATVMQLLNGDKDE